MQHGEFLSEHLAFALSLQFSSQQESVSSDPKRPASHSSSPSTRRLPQNDSSGSVKQREDLAKRTCTKQTWSGYIKFNGREIPTWQYFYICKASKERVKSDLTLSVIAIYCATR